MRTRKNAKINVLRALALARTQGYLFVNGVNYVTKDGWVPGYILIHPCIGGESGKRRKRELEEDGWAIEKRRKTNSNAFEYRLKCSMSVAKYIVFNDSDDLIALMNKININHQICIFE